MKAIRTLLSLTLVSLIAVSLQGADVPAPKSDLDALVRKFEKEIEKVRGLTFKKPVVAKVIPRTKDKSPGLQGYYDTKEKTLYVFDDLKGNYERGVLIHEMVHALQDQHFGLDKLHQSAFGGDAELARAALVEGDATFTMIEVLKKDQPRAAMMLDAPLEKARNLQNSFLYSQGARYVRALREKGGWEAVNRRYQFPPSSTAAILHPDERIVPVDLGPGSPRGEYGWIKLLASNPATAPESVRAASGWRGDRFISEDAAEAWIVAFATKEDATRFARALVKLELARRPGLQTLRQSDTETVWKKDALALAVLVRGNRALHLDTFSEKRLGEMFDRVEGPPAVYVWSTKEKKALTFGEFTDRLLKTDVICVGETHDSELTHQVQLQIIKALYACDDRLGVGMEMFQKPFQKTVDRYLAGAVDESTFLEDTEYLKRWGFDWSLYRPIVVFCKNNGIPLAALNVSAELKDRISKVGVEALTGDEKKQLGEIDYQVKAHREYWVERLAKMHGDASKVSPERKERSYQVMTTWDGYMANSAVAFQMERKVRRMVILAGSGHVDKGFGIPDRVAQRTGGKVATVHIEVGGDLEKLKKEALADFVLVVN
jgi:uncharacterized iron-regulated protein